MSEGKSANAYRTISEVAESLGVPQHVLRFWETKFPAVKPLKRGGNRRYYRPEDVDVLQVINHLLYVDGFTIKGVQKLLKERGVKALVDEYLAAQAAGVTIAEFRFGGGNGNGKHTAPADQATPAAQASTVEPMPVIMPAAVVETPDAPHVVAAQQEAEASQAAQQVHALRPAQAQSTANGAHHAHEASGAYSAQAQAIVAELKAVREQLQRALSFQP